MLSNFKKTVTLLIDKLHSARKTPFKNIKKWLDIQEKLINKIVYVEKQIQKQKQHIKELNKKKSIQGEAKSKKDSVVIKQQIKEGYEKIEEYRYVLNVFKSIGDGIAFTFLDKYDIKPLNFKESPGFLSGKKGMRNERRFLRTAFDKGIITIYNDATSVLKYADLTLITKKGPIPIEVKTSHQKNDRTLRQQGKLQKVINYLAEDKVEGLYEPGIIMQRVAMEIPETNHINQLDRLIKKAEQKGIVSSLVEKGLIYVVSYKSFSEEKLAKILSKSNFMKPAAFHVNMFKFTGGGYYPFSLIFKTSRYYYDFLDGRISILVLFDIEEINLIAEKHDFRMSLSAEEEYAFDFRRKMEDSALSQVKISEHYFNRTFMEFVSMQWIINASLKKFLEMEKDIIHSKDS